jgi:hypothetical protein
MARKVKLPEWERLTCYRNKGRDLYFLDAEALEEDRKEDPRLHQKLGISQSDALELLQRQGGAESRPPAAVRQTHVCCGVGGEHRAMSTATGRTHRGYRHEGKKIPSVTEICKGLGWSQDRLIGWANKVGREQGITTWRASKPKMRIGTLAHDMIETYLIGAEPHHVLDDAEDPPAVKEGAQRAFDGFCTLWERELAPRTEILATECKMKFHLSGLWFGGTSDLVALVDGVPTIIDYKTGSGRAPGGCDPVRGLRLPVAARRQQAHGGRVRAPAHALRSRAAPGQRADCRLWRGPLPARRARVLRAARP